MPSGVQHEVTSTAPATRSIAGMQRVNIADPSFRDDDDDPEGFRAGMYRFGPELGASQTGSSVYELPPARPSARPLRVRGGGVGALLDGRPSVRTPDGVEELEPSTSCSSRWGRRSHQVRTTRPSARVVMWSTIVHTDRPPRTPTATRSRLWTGVKGEDVMVTRASNVDYCHGEAG